VQPAYVFVMLSPCVCGENRYGRPVSGVVANCQGPTAGGGPLGPRASELKTLEIYFCKFLLFKCINLLLFFYLIEIFNVLCTVYFGVAWNSFKLLLHPRFILSLFVFTFTFLQAVYFVDTCPLVMLIRYFPDNQTSWNDETQLKFCK
jgi:hypothetical protein